MGKYHHEYIECRGLHKKIAKKITDSHKIWLEDRMIQPHRFTTISKLHKEFAETYPDEKISYSTLFRCLKNDLGFEFKKESIHQAAKNSPVNKIYRFWWILNLMKE